jgi:hypothetical protein
MKYASCVETLEETIWIIHEGIGPPGIFRRMEALSYHLVLDCHPFHVCKPAESCFLAGEFSRE